MPPICARTNANERKLKPLMEILKHLSLTGCLISLLMLQQLRGRYIKTEAPLQSSVRRRAFLAMALTSGMPSPEALLAHIPHSFRLTLACVCVCRGEENAWLLVGWYCWAIVDAR